MDYHYAHRLALDLFEMVDKAYYAEYPHRKTATVDQYLKFLKKKLDAPIKSPKDK